MSRTTILFIVIIVVAVAIALFARFGPGKTTPVTGLVGSEKTPFFADVRVQKALGRHGLIVTVQKAGSREIASRSEEKIQRELGASKAHTHPSVT